MSESKSQDLLERGLTGAVPKAARDAVRRVHRRLVFERAMKRVMNDPVGIASRPHGVLSDLTYGWSNENWSGEPEYLQACMQAALAANAEILECGSGLTTIVVGAVASHTGKSLWSLEHLPEWGARVQSCLDRFSIESVRLFVEPLKQYGEFDWYSPPLEQMPSRFDVIICDGPPSFTRGGRYGLVPVMNKHMKPGCVILLDDAEREGEQELAKRWSRELPCTCERLGATKPFFSLVRQHV